MRHAQLLVRLTAVRQCEVQIQHASPYLLELFRTPPPPTHNSVSPLSFPYNFFERKHWKFRNSPGNSASCRDYFRIKVLSLRNSKNFTSAKTLALNENFCQDNRQKIFYFPALNRFLMLCLYFVITDY